MYALKIGKEVFHVYGEILASGWLEWHSSDGSQGIAPPYKFCSWSERGAYFPDCTDA